MSYPGYYSLSKVLEEVIVREYNRNGTFPFTVVRLSAVLQEDSALGMLLCGWDPAHPETGPFSDRYSEAQRERAARGERFVVPPHDASGRPLGRTVVHRQDVVEGLVSILGNKRVEGKTLHLSGPSFLYSEPCEYLATKLALSTEHVSVPDAHSFAIDTSLTTKLTGWKPKYDVCAIVDAALEWQEERRRIEERKL